MQSSSDEFDFRRKYFINRKCPKVSKVKVVQESIKIISKEYCAESSICGLKHLVDDRTSPVERIIWVVTMIGALICSVSLVWMTFKNYYMAPLVTTQIPEGIPITEILFPAVGICSTNRISKKAVTELSEQLLREPRNEMYNMSEIMMLFKGLGQLYDSQFASQDDKFNLLQLHQILGVYDVKKLMKKVTPRCENFLLRCSWNEETKNCTDLFDFRLTMNGYCCTFNYLRRSENFDANSSHRSIDMYNYGNRSAFDYDQGLKFLLKFDTSDDFYYNVPLQGAQMQFTDAYDFPDAPSGSFAAQLIGPGVEMTVLVSASLTEASRDIQHVRVKDRGCLFYDESSYLTFYTYSDCMLKCRMLFLVEKCNCTPFNTPNLEKVRTCDLRDVVCIRKYYAQSIACRPNVVPLPPELELDLVDGGVSCPMCYPTCSKTAYSFEFNNVKLYPDYLNSVEDSDRDDWLRGANFSGTSIVHVKYASETADCYGQNVIMKWFDLISNIGSTCGFVTGFSFVSVLEFIYFFTVKFSRQIRDRQTRSRAVVPQQSQPPTVTPSAAPVIRYRPIYWKEIANHNHHT